MLLGNSQFIIICHIDFFPYCKTTNESSEELKNANDDDDHVER